ncbi:hypothetical protein P43SY_000065 [Pythium insidiosum]|uniref:Uncharacterized protein n=1 Tax=Pythium insidiosum TaxID=114742 RepID=A0AAD5LRS1_PYTIN|nr:hypothetical protein P43SY_000065 [Pythium insidiosum]
MLDSQVRDVSIALLSLRKYRAVSAHVTNLSERVKIFLNERSKVQDVRNLSVETADDGSIKIMNGDNEFELRWMDNLSKQALPWSSRAHRWWTTRDRLPHRLLSLFPMTSRGCLLKPARS